MLKLELGQCILIGEKGVAWTVRFKGSKDSGKIGINKKNTNISRVEWISKIEVNKWLNG